MTEPFEKAAQEAAAFQKLCMETMSNAMQAAFKFTPDSAPPEVLRQIRAGIFRALADSWDQFMRSPQFLEGMRQWMENAIAFRKVTNEFMGRARNEMQAPSRSDIDTVMLAVRHMEKRLLDRLDEISGELSKANGNRRPVPGTKRPRATNSHRGKKAAASKVQKSKGGTP
jgi:hypothetical protein